ncbi:MAG: S16 family serine protease, partial [Candidatus Woesearchaeota archaeon]
MKLLVWLTVIALLASSVFAQSGSIKLLALAEDSSGKSSGAVADLDLRIEPGKQRVFLETFPLTKITTQISMRFAQQVACKEMDIDCSDKDFFFTIRALQGVVGGPSAGSAAAVLTASLIAGFPLRNDTAITGTINSGGIIGPVGGIREKMEAAATSGIRRVLVPRGSRELNDSNTTTDLFKYGEVLGIEVIEVSTLLDALREYTGREFPNVTGELVIEPRYLETMKDVAIGLCNRTEAIKSSLERRGKNIIGIENLKREAVNMNAMAAEAFDSGQYYASASFCFRSNVAYKRALAMQRNWTEKDVASASLTLKRAMANFSRKTDSMEISTITDLQTYMAVKERLADVDEILLEIATNLNSTDDNIQRLAYAEERLFSAKKWARFFNNNDVKFVMDSASMKSSCMAKISES